MDRADYEPRPGWQNTHTFGGSPDGEHILVAQSWVETPPGQRTAFGDVRVTVSLVGFSGTPAQELFTLVGGVGTYTDNLEIQWSPDGTQIALGASAWMGLENPLNYSILVLDATTGQEVTRIEGAGLAGSASWSPDGTRLLFSTPGGGA